MRSDSSVQLVRRAQAETPSREWDAELRPLFDDLGADPGWRPWQVLGGPGTGKTALLVDVAAARILAGAAPESVVVLTYTKRAATAVRAAITARIAEADPDLGGVPGATRGPLVRTIHSYAFGLLRTFAATHGNPPPRLLTGSEQDIVIREMLRGDLADGARDWPERLHPALPAAGFAEQLRDLMLRATERGLGPEDLIELGRTHRHPEWVAAGRFAERYEQVMMLRWSVGMDVPEASAPALDAAELVTAALDAFHLDPELLAAERDRLHCVLVDDAQHLDPHAATLIRALGGGAATTVIAADPDQAVYTFRGADSRFATDPEAPADRRITLRRNHRSATAIQELADRIAARLPGSPSHRTPLPTLRRTSATADFLHEIARDLASGSATPGNGDAPTANGDAPTTNGDAYPTNGERRPANGPDQPRHSGALLAGIHDMDMDPGQKHAGMTDGERAGMTDGERAGTLDRGRAGMADRAARPRSADGAENHRESAQSAGEVRVQVLTTPAKEAALIADHLRRAHLTHGVPWSRMAVIVRSVPLSLAPLRRALLAAGVPVRQPPADVPLARRRGAMWMLLALRAITAGDPTSVRHPRPIAFTADDALDLLAGPLGGADQISLRRLRRGIRRAVLELGLPDRAREEETVQSAESGAVQADTEASADLDGDGASVRDRSPSDSGRDPARDTKSGGDVARDTESVGDAARFADLDRSSAEILRDLLVGVGNRVVLEKLTEVEAAPLRRVLKALGRARKVRRDGGGLEDVMWGVWTASTLERRWVGQSERGGAVGMQADRDLDAVVGLFEAAAAYVDRLPRATIEGFVEYLEQQEIPQDNAPVTDPGEAVTICSAHAAAGREWDTVAVAAVQEGIWPNLRPRGTLLGVEELVDLLAGVGGSGEKVSRVAPLLAEERRLLLVACSRARRSLLVTAVESVTGDQDLVPSRFLAEMDADAADGQPGRVPPPVDPGRALAMHALIAELRSAACDPETTPERRMRAARQLARLAQAGVRGAHPDDWYGTAELSSSNPLWDSTDGAIALSPSTVDQLKTCPLRWALERHGGGDGENPHALKGNLVHTLVQALAGQVSEDQVKAALVKAWKKVDPSARDGENWHSRAELRRTETMVDTFLAWLRNTRDELTAIGVEVPVDCVLPARSPDEQPVRISGRVDRVERDPLGRFVIVDVKTGKTPISKQAAEEHAQLATYQVAAAEGALGEGEPGGARLVYVAKPNAKEGATQRMQPPLDAEGIDTWRGVIHDAADASKGPSYLAMRNDGCRHCKVAGSCPVQDTGRQVTD
ncbi:ATP-dependent helicase [Nocardia sp. CDC160]|uniref:ATP-dependent helicase n=1 Tax=Nocardia sp. CDC160 TaxID=3112166 RepID=UPI002DB6500E|nr:PD-(D/E)XK nuclease family protein [Nocardia sp. CDC160]MEC3916449.1 PD-(D/E)XK nuclease family protein [Nocardia sp. CDC160]